MYNLIIYIYIIIFNDIFIQKTMLIIMFRSKMAINWSFIAYIQTPTNLTNLVLVNCIPFYPTIIPMIYP